MLYNNETKKVLVRSGFEWLIPLLPKREDGKEAVHSFTVELIDLESLSIGPEGFWYGGDYVSAWEHVFLFDADGRKIIEVGGKQEKSRMDWEINLKKWPFFFKVQRTYMEDKFETVGQAIERLKDSEVDAIRYIVSIPTNFGILKIRKLRKRDANLRERLRESADKAAAEINRLLQD